MINPMDLSGKIILVTGASSGLGRETSILLSELGAKVILIARREDELKKTMDMIKTKKSCYYVFDLLQIEDIESLILRIVNEHGKFDGFVHCAGISTSSPILLTTYKFIDEMMKLHVYSFIEIVRVMTKKRNINLGASIVAVSSAASTHADKGKTAYCTTKGALDSAILPLAIELGENKGIRVNTVNPGWIKTEMFYDYIEKYGQEKMNQTENQHILGVAEPSDVANVIAFLLSSASSKITGQSIKVDSGWTIW